MTLRTNLIDLTHAVPHLRKHVVPLLRQASSISCDTVSGTKRVTYLNAVWDMYTHTYKAIGLIVTSPFDLLSEFPIWELCLDADNIPHAFGMSKPTPFGLKSGLSGHDGTPDGKSMALMMLRSKFKRPGFYSEMSHRALDIVLAAGAPVVCASYVSKILGKDVEPAEDGIHYKRNISGVGVVSKVMVGHPRGVNVTDYSNPHCPVIKGMAMQATNGTSDDLADLAAHYACMACL